MIKVSNLTYTYEKNKVRSPVLDQVSFDLTRGKVSVIMGPSGCGKSTLLRILMGLETGAQGTISVDSEVSTFQKWNSDQTVFSLVPQSPHLFPWKTLVQNVALAVPSSVPASERLLKAEEALNVVQLQAHCHKYPSEISLGMAARVAFARALVMNSKALLLDEPFASLDAHTRSVMQEWLCEKMIVSNLPVLLVTHDAREALKMGAEIHLLKGVPANFAATYSFESQKLDSPKWMASSRCSEIEEHIQTLLGKVV